MRYSRWRWRAELMLVLAVQEKQILGFAKDEKFYRMG
jgi:hypothetical protein